MADPVRNNLINPQAAPIEAFNSPQESSRPLSVQLSEKVNTAAKSFFSQLTKEVKENLQNVHRFFSTIYALPNIIHTVFFYVSHVSFFVPLLMNLQFLAQILKFIANIVSIQLLAMSIIGVVTNVLQIPFTSWDLYKSYQLNQLTRTVLHISDFDTENLDIKKASKLNLLLEKAERILEKNHFPKESDRAQNILQKTLNDISSLKAALTSSTDIESHHETLKKSLLDATLTTLYYTYFKADPHIPKQNIDEVETTKLQKLKNIVGDKCAEYASVIMKTKAEYNLETGSLAARGRPGLIAVMGTQEQQEAYLKEGFRLVSHIQQKSLEHVIIHTIAITAMTLAVVGSIAIMFCTVPPLPIMILITLSSILHITNFFIRRGITSHEGHHFSPAHFLPNWMVRLVVKTIMKKPDPIVFSTDIHKSGIKELSPSPTQLLLQPA